MIATAGLRHYESLTEDGEILQFGESIAKRLSDAEGRAFNGGVVPYPQRREQAYLCEPSDPATPPYLLTRADDGWSCTCTGYRCTGMCRHLGGLSRMARREAWNFGTVARPKEPCVP